MSRLFACAVPVPQENENAWHQFMRELKDHHLEEFQGSRRKLGVRERTFFQQMPAGGLVIVTLEGENPEDAFKKFGEGKDSFSLWFMEKVKAIHGLDLSAPPPAPMPHIVIDSGEVPKVEKAPLLIT